MIKLITPPGMLLTVALMVIFSVYAFLIGLKEDSSILSAGGVMAVVAAYGTAMLRVWSQYLVYLLTAGFIAKLGHSIYAGYASGYFNFQFATVNESLMALVPSAVLVVLSCVCCVLVFGHFRRARASSTGAVTRVNSNQSADTAKLPRI